MHKRLARWRVAFLCVGPRSYITLHDTNALTILVLQVRTFHTWLTACKRRGTLHVRGIPPPRDARARPLKRGRCEKRQFVLGSLHSHSRTTAPEIWRLKGGGKRFRGSTSVKGPLEDMKGSPRREWMEMKVEWLRPKQTDWRLKRRKRKNNYEKKKKAIQAWTS